MKISSVGGRSESPSLMYRSRYHSIRGSLHPGLYYREYEQNNYFRFNFAVLFAPILSIINAMQIINALAIRNRETGGRMNIPTMPKKKRWKLTVDDDREASRSFRSIGVISSKREPLYPQCSRTKDLTLGRER